MDTTLGTFPYGTTDTILHPRIGKNPDFFWVYSTDCRRLTGYRVVTADASRWAVDVIANQIASALGASDGKASSRFSMQATPISATLSEGCDADARPLLVGLLELGKMTVWRCRLRKPQRANRSGAKSRGMGSPIADEPLYRGLTAGTHGRPTPHASMCT